MPLNPTNWSFKRCWCEVRVFVKTSLIQWLRLRCMLSMSAGICIKRTLGCDWNVCSLHVLPNLEIKQVNIHWVICLCLFVILQTHHSTMNQTYSWIHKWNMLEYMEMWSFLVCRWSWNLNNVSMWLCLIQSCSLFVTTRRSLIRSHICFCGSQVWYALLSCFFNDLHHGLFCTVMMLVRWSKVSQWDIRKVL